MGLFLLILVLTSYKFTASEIKHYRTLTTKEQIAYCINVFSKEFNIPKHVYYTIMKIESRGNPYAFRRNRNGSYDIGLMQINTKLAKQYGFTDYNLLFDVCVNLYIASLRLAYCKKKYKNELQMVGCYHSETAAKKYIKRYLAAKN